MDANRTAATEASGATRAAIERRRALPLAARLFLLSTVLVILVAGTAIVVSYQHGQRIVERESAQALDTSVGVQREFEARRLEQLQFMVQQLAADPHFVSYVANAQRLTLGQEHDTTAGSLSVHDLLVERRASHGFDLAIVLDDDATVLARSDQIEFFADNLREDDLIGRAWDELRPFSGYWRLDHRLYQAAIVPLQQDQDLIGFLLLALAVDDAFCRAIAGVSGAQIAYGLPDDDRLRIVASSLATDQTQALADRTRHEQGGSGTRLHLDIDGDTWIAQIAPVADGSTTELGAILSLASTTQAAAGYRSILNRMLLAGAAALVLALLLSLLLSKGVLHPVRRLAEATESAAAGNYRADVALPDRDELGRLSRAVDALLASLREKSDIEHYLGSLSRALPESSSAEPESTVDLTASQPPRHERLVFLATRSTRHGEGFFPPASATERAHAFEYRDDLRVLAFADLLTALHSLAQLRTATPGMIVAIHQTDAEWIDLRLSDGLQTRLRQVPFDLLHRFLEEAPAAAIVLGPTTAEACRHLLGGSAVVIRKSVHDRPMLVLAPQALKHLPRPPNATFGTGPIPGHMLGRRYRVLSLLGSGGMGAVYKARDTELDEIVALKMLRPGVLLDESQLERLKDELRLARRITHANVVRTYDYVEIDGQPCISMEYVRGMTLRFLLESSGKIPLSAGLRIARQITSGLIAAHEVGILHRDIKPENVILEANGNAKLMDFGIARPIQRSEPGHTAAGSFVGTPDYCAPEQMAGEPVAAGADLYALGVVLCEMFGGRLPHVGASTMEVYVAKLQQEPTPPSAHGVVLPAALETLILACLERNPNRRPPSAKAVLDTLTQVRA